MQRATSILKEMKLNEYWVNLYEQVEAAVEDFAVLFEFWKEGEGTEEDVKTLMKAIAAIEEAEFKSTLNEPEDELPGHTADQLRCRRYRKPGLGRDAGPHVPHVWRKARLDCNHSGLAGWRWCRH
jgi:hypothetical protein